jgi:hypothetical protein
MGMATSIVTYTIPAGRAEEVNARLRTRVLPEARRTPGFRGYLVVEQEDGTRLDSWLFDAAAVPGGLGALDRAAREQIVPLTGSPTRIVAGTVAISDGLFPDASEA